MSLDLDDIMKEMQAEFMKTLAEKVALLEDQARLGTGADFELIKREIHSLKGLGTTFNYPEVTETCKNVEQGMDNLEVWGQRAPDLLAALKKAMTS